MRYGLDEPDPSLLILGKKGDPEEALEYCQKLIKQVNLADANVLLDCLLARDLNPKDRIKALVLQASLVKTHMPSDRKRKQMILKQALEIAMKQFPEGAAPEVAQIQELLKPKALKNANTWLFETMLADRDKSGCAPFPCADILAAYFKAFEDGTLKKDTTPASFHVFWSVLNYCSSVPYDGFEHYFSTINNAELSQIRTSLENINATAELQMFDKASVLVSAISKDPNAENECTKAAYDELDDLEKLFKGRSGRTQLENLLAAYIQDHESELRSGLSS